MLKIPKTIIDELRLHGQKEAPLEACGYLAGKDGEITQFYPMRNVDQSETHFTLDPAEQFQVIRDVRKQDLEVIAVYHTHPESPARPSAEDIRLAFDPEISYVILSLLGDGSDIRSYKIKDGVVDEESLISSLTQG